MASQILQKIVHGTPVNDGAGVRLNRILGTQELPELDPFLMLDEFRSADKDDYIAGFPSHPHRGFETVTYMKQGGFRHKDSVGNSGLLEDGGLQWMTAGRGIIHSEMPEMNEGQLWGYQLWLNLPSRLKMSPPAYQDLAAERLPVLQADGLWLKVLAGSYQGLQSPVQSLHPVSYFDVELKPGVLFEHAFAEDWQPFAYVYAGSLRIQDTEIPAGQAAVLEIGAKLKARSGPDGAGFLLLGSPPIGEAVARYGPFVMNTESELRQAVADYQQGRLA